LKNQNEILDRISKIIPAKNNVSDADIIRWNANVVKSSLVEEA
jgi:hypothetical protein